MNTNITIKELNIFLMKNYDSDVTFAYPFCNELIVQCGNILYSPFNPTIYLVSEFTVKKINSYKYKLINNPTDAEFRTFLRGINMLTNLVINF